MRKLNNRSGSTKDASLSLTRVRVNPITLIEVIVACAMIVIVMTSIIGFFNKSMKLCKNYSTQAYSNQQISVIKKSWRKFVHNSDSEDFKVSEDGTKIISGNESAEMKDSYIVFTNGKKKSSYKLSKNIQIRFAVEGDNNSQDLIVMNIKLTSTHPGVKDENIRIVSVKQ
jgi:hypothetical protein